MKFLAVPVVFLPSPKRMPSSRISSITPPNCPKKINRTFWSTPCFVKKYVKNEPSTKYLRELEAALQKLSKPDLIAVLCHTHLVVAHRKLALPFPLAFALRATVCMFALLFVLPAHPLAIPTIVGGGLAFALIANQFPSRLKEALP